MTLIRPLDNLADWSGILDAIRLAVEQVANLAQTDGLRVRLPTLAGVGATGDGSTSIGVQWNVDRMDVAITDGVITDPQGLFERLAGEAERAGERLKG